ncbi:hypothetical protein BCCH1_20400 [Burkholderia contaminans]|uniref:Uncharacterized protein n=1 Tax=Burkholderia contaminans TaxID=488447 RepID=A0A250L4V2_9BURK|nr:hypothetical protein BCCH1_20400 [Burkholderia contaminans]GLZ69617.1 hypothetical protein Bcon01_26620 [Burkholderia contaminans]
MRASKQGTVGKAEKAALEQRPGGARFERARGPASDMRRFVPCNVDGPKAPRGGRFADSDEAARQAAERPGNTDSYTRRTRAVQPRSRGVRKIQTRVPFAFRTIAATAARRRPRHACKQPTATRGGPLRARLQ